MTVDLTRFLGPAVRQHRELLRLTQEELAYRAGLDRTYVSGIERGKRNPTVKILQQVAEGLGVDLDVIFSTARAIGVKSQERP